MGAVPLLWCLCCYRISERAKDAIAGVAEARDDIAFFIEVVVDGCDVDRDVGVFFVDDADALGGGHEAHERDGLCAFLF